MKSNLFLLAISLTILLNSCQKGKEEKSLFSRNQDFTAGWRFSTEVTEHASDPDFDDSGWRLVNLPHDISVEDLPVQDGDHTGPFYRLLENGGDVGYLRGGQAWYRKSLTLKPEDAGKVFILHFDGIQSESEVFVNGKPAAEHKYGYTAFHLDLTPYLNEPGKENIIAVKVVNPDHNSRWFAGFGIYRQVSLSVLQPVHIRPWGVFVTTSLEDEFARVSVRVEVENNSDSAASILVKTTLRNPSGGRLESSEKKADLKAGEKAILEMDIPVPSPSLWSPDTPDLYSLTASVYREEKLIDEETVGFGIRSIEFSAEKGFLLNGNPMELKGACMHHDNGLLGAAAFERAEYRRVEIMKQNGYNAIRTSHNPPSSFFLEACDRLGMLVIDEAFDVWELPKRKNDYHLHFPECWEKDLEAMVLRDRNHPSVIMWSYGNEVQERARPRGIEIAGMLTAKIRNLDPTRPVTQAICSFWDNPGMDWEKHTPPAFALMDVAGYNYQHERYLSDHVLYPSRIMYGSESVAKEAFINWKKVKEMPWVTGDFVWTGMDYIGEAGIGISVYAEGDTTFKHPQSWPWYNAWCGDIDLIGNKKPQSLYRDVVWGESRLEILVHEPIPAGKKEITYYWGWPKEYPSWTWQGSEGDTLEVNVYSSYPRVRLELNGRLIGEQEIDQETGITASFRVPYEPGELKATGIGTDSISGTKSLFTSGKPAGIRLETDQQSIRAGRDQIVFLKVKAVDENGKLAETAAVSLQVEVNGPGELLAAGNANPFIEGSLQDRNFSLYRGQAMLILRSTGKAGKIKVAVRSEDGLSETVRILAIR